jgi:hypothetical protein
MVETSVAMPKESTKEQLNNLIEIVPYGVNGTFSSEYQAFDPPFVWV